MDSIQQNYDVMLLCELMIFQLMQERLSILMQYYTSTHFHLFRSNPIIYIRADQKFLFIVFVKYIRTKWIN